MILGTRYLICFVIIVQIGVQQCWGSRSSTGRRPTPSPHRPFPTHAPTHRPTHAPTYRPTHAPTHRPFPTHAPTSRPFPTHAPTHKPFPTHAPTHKPTTTFKPFPTHAPTHRTTTHAPTHRTTTRAPTYRTTTHAPTHRPFPTQAPTHRPFPTQAPTYRPYPTHAPTHRPFPTHSPTYRPHPTPAPTYRPSPTHYPPVRTTKYPTQSYPTGPRPSYPGFSDGGINSPKHYQPSYSVPVRVPSPGGTKIKIYNINNYHPPSYWAPPSYPVYHYTNRDTGNSALGLYLGYNLGRISRPTYYHQDNRFYDGYSPRYDHYTVHHYYHNSGSIPRQQTVTTKVIIQCGDGSQICPANTTSLCTANGQIMCVVIASNTVPCQDNPNMRCVKSSIPCENNESPECKGVTKGQMTTVSIPCISNTTIEGNVTTVNNTIVSKDPKPLPLTTTSSTVITTMRNIPDLGSRRKRDVVPPLQYCVTVVAEPSKREPTEGEKVFKEITSVFDKFFTKAFGIDKQIQKPPVKNDNYIPQFGD